MRTVAIRLLCVLSLSGPGCQGATVPAEPEAGTTVGPVIAVAGSYPGASAQVVSETIAAPLEQQLQDTEGMALLQSECRNDGTFTIRVRFSPETKVDVASVLVQNRVNLAEPMLPDACRALGVTIRKDDPERFPAVWVALSSTDNTHDARFLSNYVELKVRHDLARVVGVAEVRAVGVTRDAIRIWLDPDRLAARSLTTSDVVAALQKQNVQVAAGQVGQPPKPGDQHPLLTANPLGKLSEPRQLEEIILRTGEGGKVVYLRDVAKIELGASGGGGFTRTGGKPAVLVAVHLFDEKSGAEGVRDAVTKLEQVAPEGLKYQVISGPAVDQLAVVELRLPTGVSVARTAEAVACAEKLIRALPGVAECFSYSEREANTTTVLVKLTAKDPATVADVRKSLADLREAAVRVSDLPAGQPFPIRIALTDAGQHGYEKLQLWADAVAKRLADDGIALDPSAFPGAPVPQVQMTVDREKAEKLGVPISDVYTTLQANLGSVHVNDFNQFGRTYQVRVQADGKTLKPEDMKKLHLRGKDGKMVSLGTIMDFKSVEVPPAVLRVNALPAIRITAAASPGKSVAEVTAKCVAIAEEEGKKLNVPDGFRVVNLVTGKPR